MNSFPNRFWLLPLAAAALLAGACATPVKDHERPAVLPFGPAPARVTLVNAQHRFVVIDFSGRVMPAIGTRLSVYRVNQLVGAVQLTEPVRSRFATADVVEGEPRVGDEAR